MFVVVVVLLAHEVWILLAAVVENLAASCFS